MFCVPKGMHYVCIYITLSHLPHIAPFVSIKNFVIYIYCNDPRKSANHICVIPPLKSLTSLLGPTLWGSVFESTRDYRADSDTICNDPRKNTNSIYAILQKDQSQLRLLIFINKAQFNPVNTRCGTHHTPTHIIQSIKLGHHIYIKGKLSFYFLYLAWHEIELFPHYVKLNRRRQKYNFQLVLRLLLNLGK